MKNSPQESLVELEEVLVLVKGNAIPREEITRLTVGRVGHVILVSALGQNPSFFLFWGTFIQLGGLLGQGPGLGLGPGLDNK